MKAVTSAITDAAKQGCVVLILSENAVASDYIKREISLAISEGAYILPVIIGDIDLPPEFMYYMADKQFYRLSMPASEEQISEIVKLVERISLERLNE